MVKTVFSTMDYGDYLRAEIDRRAQRGLISRMADAADCQRSHISRVIAGQLHLTLDQAFRISRFLQMSEEEAAYFMKLVEYGRSGDHEYRASLARELKRLKSAHEDLSKRLKEPSIGSSERELTYYSSWYWSAIHIIVSIPEYQGFTTIAQRLNLPASYVEACLKRLRDFGLVQYEKGKWTIAGGSIHLNKNSPLNSVQHSNWRSRAVLASQAPEGDGVHYTVVQSVSRADYEKIRQLLLKAIDDYAKVAKPSKEEELICFLCDFFRV